MTKFAVVFHGRCGSAYLRMLLNTSPEVHFEGEKLLESLKRQEDGAAAQVAMVHGFYQKAQERRRKHPKLICAGFKIKPNDLLDKEGFYNALIEEKAKVIHMQRRNRVKQGVSILNSLRLKEVTGSVHLRKGQTAPGPFELDIDRFRKLLKNLEIRETELTERVASLPLPVHHLDYEELLTDRQATLASLGKFLDIDPALLDHESDQIPQKQTKDDLTVMLLNFQEVRRLYEGTPYETMFDEVLVH